MSTSKHVSTLDALETERAIHFIKNEFQAVLARKLCLVRVTAPIFVRAGTGINDDLNGVERPVTFAIRADGDSRAVVVHSLAKWKRMTLARYAMRPGRGIYTDMNAIRADEDLDAIHSLYVDQWDWERVMTRDERTLDYLMNTVRDIWAAIRHTDAVVSRKFFGAASSLPADIHFVHAQELEDMWPDLTPKQRENEICKAYGAIFVIGIGCPLASGKPHDGRASDYDDWSTPTADGRCGLNGDILVWNSILRSAFELSSMGIRVDEVALDRQLTACGHNGRRELPFHRALLAGQLPQSIGGGIGQSRLCMLLLRKPHIGQVQASVWPDRVIDACREEGIELL